VAATRGQTVPIIARADVLVVDSSLPACVAAVRIAGQGRKVILAASGTSLPWEMATCLRPWARRVALAGLPKDVAAVLSPCVKTRSGGEVIFHMGRLTQGLEDMLLDAGVGLYYDLQPCGVVRSGRRVTGVVFACKAGLVGIEARATVDGTGDARIAALAGAAVVARKPPGGRVEVRYSMLCREDVPESGASAPDVKELIGGKVLTHGPFAEFRVALEPANGVFRASALGLRARLVAAEAARALRKSGAWKDAAFARGGDAVLVEPARRLTSRSKDGRLETDACRPEEIDNLLVCSPAVDVTDETARGLQAPLRGLSLAGIVAGADWAALCAGVARGGGQVRLAVEDVPSGDRAAARACFAEVEPVYRTGADIRLDEVRIPVVATCDVLVAGGGTSGVPAAWVASRRGVDTIVVEKHGDLGGTHTIGGVPNYWFGRRTDFVARLDGRAAAAVRATGMPKSMGMLDLLVRAGARVIPNCLVVGTVLDGETVSGVVAAVPSGLVAIEAKRVIDATGDGDLAARAGAAVEWGTARDAMTLWYSFGLFRGADARASRQYHSSVDLRDAADVSRAIITSRRRPGVFGRGEYPQVYLAPRESRHVKGRHTVTYGDILGERRCRDVVVVCRSNFDIKGIADSDLAMCGYAEPEFRKNYTARIPYRALLPEKLENLLVVGKAYSITHDALALARMQRDLMAMGGAAGLAAATAVQEGKPLSAVDVPSLQQGLVELGVLSASHLTDLPGREGAKPAALTEDRLRRLVGELRAGTISLSGTARLLRHGRGVRPLLRKALAGAAPAGRARLARALCFLGDEAGADVLLAELRRQLAAAELPKSRQKAHRVPDHGYAPEPAFLINTLGRLGEKRVLPLLTGLARRIRMNPQKSDDMFQYVYAICYAAERIGDPGGIEALTILADKPGVRSGVLPVGSDPRRSLSVVAERYAYLELCVGRALARCGSRRGYRILIDYLNDIRGVLARSAHEELADLSGEDRGYDRRKWRSWLAATPAPLRPKPYRRRID